MTDKFSAAKRSSIMSSVRSVNTKPEIKVRSLVHRLGYRFRLHRRNLPGVPDLVFASRRKVLFVHGCFWHGHQDCTRSQRPASNADFWNLKLSRNIERDEENTKTLEQLGWQVGIVWECQTKSSEKLRERLEAFLHG